MPTRRGVAVVVAAVACLVAGRVLGYPELGVLGVAGLAAAALAALVVAWRPALGLSRETHPNRVTRGEPAVCVLTVRNGTRWPTAAALVRDRLGDAAIPVDIPGLRPGGSTLITYRLSTGRRGVYDVGPLRFERHDPFGLATAGRDAGERRVLYVHPLTHPMSVAPSGRSRSLEGPLSDSAQGSSATFDRLREYVPGDDPRFVHWRSSARTGTLMVRENIDTSLPTTVILLDTARGSYADATAGPGEGPGRGARTPARPASPALFEEAVEVAASALTDTLRAGFPVRCQLGGAALGGRGGSGELADYLDRFAEVTAGESGSLAELVEALPRTQADSMLLAVSGRARPADIALLHRVAPRYRRVVLVALTPEGGQGEGAPGGQDTSTGGIVIIIAATAAEACRRWNLLARAA